MNEIKEFLQNQSFSFDKGLALLKKYDPNPGVVSFIEQRKDERHLRYELGRLSRNTHLKPVPGYVERKAQEEAPSFAEPASEDNSPMVVKYEDLKQRHQNTKFDDMPNDYLKDIYKKNQALYKDLQYAHSQMKLANSDAGRADWRKKVLDCAAQVRDNWRIIDDEITRLNTGKQTEGEFKESTCRAFISNKLRKKAITPEDIIEVRKRVEMLQQHGCVFKPETEEKLKALKVL